MLAGIARFISALLNGVRPGAGTDAQEDNEEMRLASLNRKFSSELFAQLLTELPAHRKAIIKSHAVGDDRQLSKQVHQLLGAVTYCDLPELETRLRELRLALRTGNRDTIDIYHQNAVKEIDGILKSSGYRES